MRDEPRFVAAFAVYKLDTGKSMTAIEQSIAALRMAMRINNVPVRPCLLTEVVREVNKRRRRKSVKKRSGLLFTEVTAINNGWGDMSQCMAWRMIALAMVVAFLSLLRYSDLCGIHMHGMYWCKAGVMICLPRRKNNQHGVPTYLPIADTRRVDEAGEPCSAVARLRAFIKDLTGEAPPSEGWLTSVATDAFLFRRIKCGTHTHLSEREDEIVGSGARPMGRAAYGGYLSRYRDALRMCCRMSKTAAATFGTQSARSGGDTWLFNNGVPADLRMEIGEWATPTVERGYLRIKIQQKLELVSAVGL